MLSLQTTINQRIDSLVKSPWADGMSSHELQMLATYMHVLKVAKGEVILREGKTDSLLCLIVEGKVQVSKQNDKGDHLVIATINPGRSFGEISILDGEPHSADVSAVVDTTLLVLTLEKLNLMIHEKPGIGAKLLLKMGRLLSKRLRMMDGRLIEYL